MGGWQELTPVTAQVLDIYRRMEIPPIKKNVSPTLHFEDQHKEALLASVFAAQALFQQLGLRIKYRGLENLRGRRVVFAANHQGGNLDALVISLILFLEKERIPYIPTSDRLLDVRLVGQFTHYLKYIGPFFIRTSFKEDPEYMVQVTQLLSAILDARQYLLFFPEGYTSKHGKVNPFRRGLVKSLLSTGPVTFCPVSVTYESALNDKGVKEEAFSPTAVLGGVLQRQVGTVYVNFGECLDGDPSTNHKLFTTRLQTSICREIPILTVDLLALVLLETKSLTLAEAEQRVTTLEPYIRSTRIPYIGKSVSASLKALQHLVTQEKGRITLTDPIALHFYRNRALPAFWSLARSSDLLRYECVWWPTSSSPTSEIQGLAARMVSPLVTAYTTTLQSLIQGQRKVSVLRELMLSSPATSCYTIRNLLQVLEEEGRVRVQGDEILLTG